MKLSLGIDIGGTSTKIGLVDSAGKIVERSSFSTFEKEDENDFFRALFLAIDHLLADKKQDVQLTGIGAGAPSVNEQEGTIENAANLPFSAKVDFVKVLKEKYALPVFLVKDSNAATLGEWHFGAARGMQHFLLLTLGTGLGCGVVTNGRLLNGFGGHGSEAGHVCVNKFGRECGCGRRGCLETYVSATGLKRTVFKLMAGTMIESTLRSISYDSMTAKTVWQAANDGDLLARRAFAYTGEVLGRALADMAAWFEPEAFILSGGLAAAGDLLFGPTIESLEQHALAFHKGKMNVLPSALGENDAAIVGAASLLWSAENR